MEDLLDTNATKDIIFIIADLHKLLDERKNNQSAGYKQISNEMEVWGEKTQLHVINRI